MSGTAGSTVASRNRNGAYLRTRSIPINPNSLTQQNARNDLSVATKGWASLTDAQRAAFTAAAVNVHLFDSLGRPYTPTGHQYYVSINRTAYVYSGATTAVTTPPTAAAPPALVTSTITATA